MCEWDNLWKNEGLNLPWVVDIPEMNLQKFLMDYEILSKVLDLGCGHGYHTNTLSNFCDKVTGLDISSAAIHIARKRYPHINFVVNDILLYETNEKFNFIYDKGCFHHIQAIEDKLKYVKKVSSILDKYGFWFCIVGKLCSKIEPYMLPQIKLSNYIDIIVSEMDIINIESTYIPAINNLFLPAWKILSIKKD
jgi:predicted TPR repeat methyltransferase